MRILLGCAFFLMASSALADETASSTSEWPKHLGEKMAFTYFGQYRGAQVNDPGNRFQPTTEGALDSTSPQALESYVTTGYKIDRNWMIGVSSHFLYTPLGNPGAEGKDFTWLDPSLVVSRANWIDSGGFKLKGMMFFTAPTSSYDYMKPHGVAATISPTVSMVYDVPGTKLSVGTYGYVSAYVPGPNASADYRNYKVYVAPNFNYQFTRQLAATMWVDLIQAKRTNQQAEGASFLHGLRNADMDFEPGVNWEFVKNWAINPMLNIYPRTLTWAATSFQAVLTGTVF